MYLYTYTNTVHTYLSKFSCTLMTLVRTLGAYIGSMLTTRELQNPLSIYTSRQKELLFKL